ncbi:MAG: hypothetical protein IRZ31_18740 [Thermogemmatispora sp.]|uniref:hypothetical protein n=1 Tax=Thermogemmatispora sp. TaxID=1968838 RepID=UPI002613C2F3|nr:hypothetical protein [Thermogemmatispora sp.]MBX5458936.1 hypothetical protein [Thermogemmatispora sp.]
MAESSVVVGVFENVDQARQAYDRLRAEGFGADYVSLANPQEMRRPQLGMKYLTEAGIPDEEARFYAQEFSEGHALITVRVAGLPPTSARKAVALLQEQGAYDAHTGRERRGPYAPNIRTEQPSPFFDLTYPEDLAQPATNQPSPQSEEGRSE